MSGELVFTKAAGTVRLADGGALGVVGGDPIVPSKLAVGEVERLRRMGAVGDSFPRPEWLTPPALEHRQIVQRAMGLTVEPDRQRPAPLERTEITNPNESSAIAALRAAGEVA